MNCRSRVGAAENMLAIGEHFQLIDKLTFLLFNTSLTKGGRKRVIKDILTGPLPSLPRLVVSLPRPCFSLRYREPGTDYNPRQKSWHTCPLLRYLSGKFISLSSSPQFNVVYRDEFVIARFQHCQGEGGSLFQ